MRRPKRKPRIRRRRTVIAAAVAGVVLVAALGVFLLNQRGGADVVVPAANSVVRIDADTNVFDEAVPVGEDPTGVAIGEDGDVWVINEGDSTVNRIDPETREVTPAKSTLGIPTGVAAGESAVWITNGFGSASGTQVVTVDPTTESVEVAFPSGNEKAIVVAFESIWLADADRDQVLRFDPQNLSAGPTAIAVDDDGVADEAPRFLAVGTDTAEGIWVANELGDTVVRIDPATDEVDARIPVEGPTGVAAGDSGIWVTSETLDRVHRFDAADGRALQTYQQEDGILDGPTVIALGPSGVWIGSDLESAIARIAPGATTVERLALDGIAGGLVVDGSGDVWVTIRAPF